ncbi:MAG: hypothetical protein MI742_01190 [Desulfobacterales bacterium]|nr:hypothetical protein [Desulfobacterales bacterium]
MARSHGRRLKKSNGSVQKCTQLLWYLATKGHSRDEINRLIQDVFNVIRDGGNFTIAMINGEMQALGWPPCVVDETSFEMLVSLMEDEMGYSIKAHTVN